MILDSAFAAGFGNSDGAAPCAALARKYRLQGQSEHGQWYQYFSKADTLDRLLVKYPQIVSTGPRMLLASKDSE